MSLEVLKLCKFLLAEGALEFLAIKKWEAFLTNWPSSEKEEEEEEPSMERRQNKFSHHE